MRKGLCALFPANGFMSQRWSPSVRRGVSKSPGTGSFGKARGLSRRRCQETSVRLQTHFGWGELRGKYSGKYRIQKMHGKIRIQKPHGKIWIQKLHGKIWIQKLHGKIWIQKLHGKIRVQKRSGRNRVQKLSGRNRIQKLSGRPAIFFWKICRISLQMNCLRMESFP